MIYLTIFANKNRHFTDLKNKIKFVDSKFVKICDELVIGRDINAPFLQLVGFDKVGLAQSNYSKLKTISVRNMGVYGSGDNLESYQGNLLKGIDNKPLQERT